MKRIAIALCSVMLLIAATCLINAQDMQKQPTTKPAKAKPVMPTNDADIQKCVQEKFANAPSMKDKQPSVMVSGGVATITGEAKNSGQKGAASNIAKACGAKEIKNEMTVAAKKK